MTTLQIVTVIGFVLGALLLAVKLVLSPAAKVTLNTAEFVQLPLIQRTEVSHDTRVLRFGLPSQSHCLGLPVGHHIAIKAVVAAGQPSPRPCQRSYTPISSDDDHGFVDLLVKVYFSGRHPDFPNGGLMSQHLDGLMLGDTVMMKRTGGRFTYNGQGRCTIRGVARRVKRFAMIAGGSGITPILQVIRAVLKNKEDLTELHLLYANKTVEDVLLRDEIDRQAEADPRLTVWHTITRGSISEAAQLAGGAAAAARYGTGRVDKEMIEKHLPTASPETLVLMCGPSGLIREVATPALRELGFAADEMIAF